MMWVGNSALVAFNMLIVIDLFADHLFKPVLGFEMPVFYRASLLLMLSAGILALHKIWRYAISLQLYITLSFVVLFLIHVITVGENFNIAQPVVSLSFVSTPLDFVIYTLSASAYIYHRSVRFPRSYRIRGEYQWRDTV